MYSYSAYGLIVHSDLELPELRAEMQARSDVAIRFGKVGWRPPGQVDRGYQATPDEIYLFWREIGAFSIIRGQEVVVDPEAGVEEYVLRTFILGAVIAAVLHQRGLLVLHASAVNVVCGAMVFVGDKGWGKSTLAASMQARRHSLIADDVVAVEVGRDLGIHALPGSTHFKLWPDVITSLGIDPEVLPKLHPRIDKRIYQVRDNIQTTPVPLRSVYILDEGESLEIVSLTPQEAMIELIRHTYLARYMHATDTASLNFRQCSAIADTVSVFRLKRPRALQMLTETASLLESSLAQVTL